MASGQAGRPKPGDGEIVVSFKSKLPVKFQVPEDHFVLPSTLARYGLSEVVNRLLSFEQPVPFDFLIDGEYLRTSLAQYIQDRKLASEQVLKLEYVLAVSEPEQANVDQVPDWVSSIAALHTVPSPWFGAVSYDGVVRVYEGAQPKLAVKLSDEPLGKVAALPVEGNKSSLLVAACKDGSVRCCALHYDREKPVLAGRPTELRAPAASTAVEAVAINEDGTLLASSGWNPDVLVWNVEAAMFPAPDASSSGTKRKSTEDHASAVPKFTLKGHSQVVTCLQYGERSRYPYTLLSGSWDSTLRVWDVAAASCVCNWTVARVVTSFSTNCAMPAQIATSHEDGHVSLWDVRAAPHATVKGALSLDISTGLPLASAQVPHRRLASQVAWCPVDANRIASAGHDGRVCILDPRSPKMPLQAIHVGKAGRNPTKLLCLAWLSGDALAVGGSDGRVVQVSLGHSKVPDDE